MHPGHSPFESLQPPAAPRRRSKSFVLRWCGNGCGEVAVVGPLGWWPCCSKACWEAWRELEAAKLVAQTSTARAAS
jgi:hypothetical protein